MTGTVWLSGFSTGMYSQALLDPISGSDIDSHHGLRQIIQPLCTPSPICKPKIMLTHFTEPLGELKNFCSACQRHEML